MCGYPCQARRLAPGRVKSDPAAGVAPAPSQPLAAGGGPVAAPAAGRLSVGLRVAAAYARPRFPRAAGPARHFHRHSFIALPLHLGRPGSQHHPPGHTGTAARPGPLCPQMAAHSRSRRAWPSATRAKPTDPDVSTHSRPENTLVKPIAPRRSAWYTKPDPPFSDVLAFMRQTLWRRSPLFRRSPFPTDSQKTCPASAAHDYGGPLLHGVIVQSRAKNVWIKSWRKWNRTVARRLGFRIGYLHLESSFVKAGDIVKKGQVIGDSGTSGTWTPHLHVELQAFDGDGKITEEFIPDKLSLPLKGFAPATHY